MHSFANHAPEFIRHYGSVAKFSQEGLEKLNDITTKHYQRSTNHRDQEALSLRNVTALNILRTLAMLEKGEKSHVVFMVRQATTSDPVCGFLYKT